MNILKLLALFSVITASLLVVNGCNKKITASPDNPASTASSNANKFTTITAKEGKTMLDSKKDLILLDVRTKEEFAESHIPGSILLPYDEINSQSSKILPNKEKTILIYCRSGRRSAIAAESLVKLGYKNVFDMGGIIDWPYEVIKE